MFWSYPNSYHVNWNTYQWEYPPVITCSSEVTPPAPTCQSYAAGSGKQDSTLSTTPWVLGAGGVCSPTNCELGRSENYYLWQNPDQVNSGGDYSECRLCPTGTTVSTDGKSCISSLKWMESTPSGCLPNTTSFVGDPSTGYEDYQFKSCNTL